MLIAVISDSHDHNENICRAAQIAAHSGCRELLHLGDITSPAAVRALASFPGRIRAVFGNCDYERSELRRAFHDIGGSIDIGPLAFCLAGKRVIMMHEPANLADLANSGSTDIVLYGHTHSAECHHENGTMILNPGECGSWSSPSSFAILNTDDLSVVHVPI